MKKILILSIVCLSLAVMSGYALAQEGATQDAVAALSEKQITAQGLGVEDPGMLPTSRFYFLKNWSRAVKRTFTFNPVKKANLELDIVNQQAAEIEKIKEISPERADAIAKAAGNYQNNAERLKNRLETLKETSQNPNVDKLIEKLTDRSVKHQQLFDELKQKFDGNPELKRHFEAMQDKINEALAKVPEKFDSPDAFKERVRRIMNARPEGAYKELRNMEMIDRMMEKMPTDPRDKLGEIKDDFMKKLEDRMGQMPENRRKEFLRPEILGKLPGSPELRIRIMEEMKMRVSNPDLQKEIIEAKEGVLKEKIEKGEIKKEAVERLMSETRDLIAKMESGLANMQSDPKQIVEKMLSVAKSRLAEAKEALVAGKIGEAFGHATAANAAVRNALRPESFLNRPTYIDPVIRQAIPMPAPTGVLPIKVTPKTEIPSSETTTSVGKCGDGICDAIEREKSLCATDCR